MLRFLIPAGLVLALASAATAQTSGTLRVTIALAEADGTVTPAPRHALLVSDDPPTAEPRRIITGLDGAAQVSLRPGSYTVESDRPLAFRGRRYEWLQVVEVAAGSVTVLELTAANAEVAAGSGASAASDPGFLLHDWQQSVFAIWTPATHASGFLVDANGLVLTNARGVGAATTVEVQLTPTTKVAGQVLAADAERDIAVVRIDPKVAAAARPVPLACTASAAAPDLKAELFTLGQPLRGEADLASGRVLAVQSGALATDLVLPSGSAGGPVFATDGTLVGLTSLADPPAEGGQRDVRVVPIEQACAPITSARQAMARATPPSPALLPIEPTRPFPMEALAAAVERRAGSVQPYAMSSADFDIAFLTPIAVYADLNASSANRRTTSKETRDPKADLSFIRPRMDFGGWTDYVSDIRPVLLVRLTPRFVEGFWTKVGRVAAETQGVMLPQVKRFKAGFGRLRVRCGAAEVLPIHPFELETRVAETATIDEGLYVFDPGALGPHCGTVTFELESAAAPGKVDTRVVDPKIIEQLWEDFAPFRDSKG